MVKQGKDFHTNSYSILFDIQYITVTVILTNSYTKKA